MATSVHWHSLAIRNDMDGVRESPRPDPPGGSFAFGTLLAMPAPTFHLITACSWTAACTPVHRR
jgi:FtsP/CotA-like multicopper oxidase with cupredoxin domain